MRHSHGLRAAAGGGIVLPAIGTAFQGGFFAGTISHTANGVATHALIVAPSATGTTRTQWKTTATATAGTDSPYDGATNSANMNNANHPAAQFCETLSIGGYTDWYLPARYELEIAYYNLKPTTNSNDTSCGINAYSVPARGSNYTAGTPAQTTVTAFQSGNSEAFIAISYGTRPYWSSTSSYSIAAYYLPFDMGQEFDNDKRFYGDVRAFRKVSL